MADSPLDDPEVVLFNGDTIPLSELAGRIDIATGGDSSIFNAKGDLLVGTGAGTGDRLPVGLNNQSLIVDSASPLGVKWSVPAGTGDVVGPTVDVVDSHVVLFSGTTGEVLKSAGMTLNQPVLNHVALADPHTQYALDADFLTAVRGPASAITNNVPVFSDTTGKVIKDSGVSLLSTGMTISGDNGTIELGGNSIANTPHIDFHSSGLNADYDTRLISSAGSASVGQGTLSIYAANTYFTGHVLPLNNNTQVLGANSNRFTTLNTHTIPPGTGTLALFANITDAVIATSDITTNNATTAKHGFLPKLSGVATQFLNGNGLWTENSITDHTTALDPHPQYATDADLAAHVAAADPHPQYLTAAEEAITLGTYVQGPATSTASALAVYSDTTGKLLRDSVATLSASSFGMNVANASFELGAVGTANTPFLDFHSSGINQDHDVRLVASGGAAGIGLGSLTVNANTTIFKTWSGTGDAFRILPGASAGVDYLTVVGSPSAGGGNPILGAAGTSTNVHVVLQPKGTGAVRPANNGLCDLGLVSATWNHVYAVFLNLHTIPVTAAGTLALTYDISDANLITSDITTNNVSTSKHGFAPKLSGNATTYLDGTGNYSAAVASAFPAGTVMGFFNTTAPVGWVQLATHDNKAVRIANTASGGSSGGSVAFTSAFGLRTTSGYLDNATFDSNYNGSHAHASSAQAGTSTTSGGASGTQAALAGSSTSWVTGYSGGGWGHAHTYHGSDIDMRVQYVDMILATKS